jgi:polysaccharide export outer membrane protein
MTRLRTLILIALVTLAGSAAAQGRDGKDSKAGKAVSEYVIGTGDIIQLNVWQVPSLDRELTVRPDGMVVLPMTGEIRAAGRTLKQLEQDIVSRLRDFNRNVTSVSLVVTEYQSRSIYVLGRVLKPGKYSYAEPINLFDLIRDAGGFTDDAQRTRVKLVHRDGNEESIEYANVELALNTGTLDKLPSVRAGDTVLVSKRGTTAGSDGVQLIGAVRAPSIYPLEEVDDLVGVLLLAGGPTELANLERVRLIRDDPARGSVAREVNVKAFLERGVASENPAMEPGDTVFVPSHPPSGGWLRGLRTLSLAIGTVASGIALYYAVSN